MARRPETKKAGDYHLSIEKWVWPQRWRQIILIWDYNRTQETTKQMAHWANLLGQQLFNIFPQPGDGRNRGSCCF